MANNYTVLNSTGATVTIGSTDTGGGVQASWVRQTDGTNFTPTGDAATRRMYVTHCDGTNAMPAGDAVGRAILHKITDGTNIATVKAASTPPINSDLGLVVAQANNLSKYKFRALSTATNIKTSAGTLQWLEIVNTNASTAWVQIFDTSAAAVTLGATTPDLEFQVSTGTTTVVQLPTQGAPFATAISVASTTAEFGNTGSGSGVNLMAMFS